MGPPGHGGPGRPPLLPPSGPGLLQWKEKHAFFRAKCANLFYLQNHQKTKKTSKSRKCIQKNKNKTLKERPAHDT
mgnify:CR=1 FL=1